MAAAELSDFYFQPEPELYNIRGKELQPITEFFDADYPSVAERYFAKYFYHRDDKTIDEMHSVLIHSNRICLVGLDKSHVACQKGIAEIKFDIGNCDRSKNQCVGKKKKGAMNLQSNSALAIVRCVDGTEYKVLSSVTGKLVEVNERLINDVSLIGQDGDGYIAVVLPKIEKFEKIKKTLLTEEQLNVKLTNAPGPTEENGSTWNKFQF